MILKFYSDPEKRLQDSYQRKLEAAMQAQQQGNIRLYSELSAQAEELYIRLQQIRIDKANK